MFYKKFQPLPKSDPGAALVAHFVKTSEPSDAQEKLAKVTDLCDSNLNTE